MSNSESQENELLSLQSIFEDKEFSVDGMDPPSGRIVAEVRLPDGFYVTATKDEQADTIRSITQEEFRIDHLPPILLFFEFPCTYPLDTCPAFLLSCNWLSLQQLSFLCDKLEYIWENNRDAILYTWMQFLQDEALDFLDIKECLDITELLKFKLKDNFTHRKNNSESEGANCESTTQCNVVPSITGGDGAIDKRAFNELSDGKKLIQSLKEYNEYKKDRIFQNSLQDCNVCLLRKKGSDFVKFKTCKHYFCNDCVKEYFEELIKDGNVNNLKCLQGECSSELDGSSVRHIVRRDLYERYDRLLLSTTLEGMSDISYCPRKDCQCACIIDTCGRMGTCPACHFVFCPFCKMTYHGVAPCNFKTEQRKQIFDEYTNADSTTRESMEKRYGKRAIRALVEDTLSESWKASNSQNCPHCRASIEKTEGCNKMTCFRCGTFFCWLCKKILMGNPYLHFRDVTSSCYNMLFPEDYMENEFEDVLPGEFLNGYEIVL